MPKSKPQSRSLFAALPVDLKRSLRSQGFVRPPDPVDVGSQVKDLLDSVPPVAGPRVYLATQPASSPSLSPDEISHDLHTSPEPTDQPIASSSKPPSWAWPAKSASKSEIVKTPVQNSKRASAVEEGTSAGSRRKKRRRNTGKENPFAEHPWDCTGLVPRYQSAGEVPVDLQKYWYQRLTLFPLYDQLPLLLDHTGWFSVTPHPIAEQIALRCQCDVIVDAFCGVGGNAVEFAKTCERVIAIDNDPTRLRLARHNALHLGVADRIEFVLGDFVQWAQALAARDGSRESIDVIFLSPPWGGMEYLTSQPSSSITPNSKSPTAAAYSLVSILPIHGAELFEVCKLLTPNIAYYLPRNMDLGELGRLADSLPHPDVGDHGQKRDREWVEIEEEWFGDKLKAITAYYGALIMDA